MDARLEIRCYYSEKQKWKEAADNSVFPDLSSWMRHTMNVAARAQKDKPRPRRERVAR